MTSAAFLPSSPFILHRGGRCLSASSRRPTVRAALHRNADDGKRELELNWRFQDENNRRPVACKGCNGTGFSECRWCNATGVLMLGDTLLCSVEGGCSCLNCIDGDVKCKRCKGTGKIAAWLQ